MSTSNAPSAEEKLRQAELREVSLARRVAQFNDMVQELRGRNDALQEELLEAKQASSIATARNVAVVEALSSDLSRLKQSLEKATNDNELLSKQLKMETDHVVMFFYFC